MDDQIPKGKHSKLAQTMDVAKALCGSETENANPLSLWRALLFLLIMQEEDGKASAPYYIIPDWIAGYLKRVAGNLDLLEHGSHFEGNCQDIETTSAKDLVPAAMELVQGNWSAFASAQSVASKIRDYWLYELAVDQKRMSSKEAIQFVQSKTGARSERQTLRRVAEGRALYRGELSEIPSPSSTRRKSPPVV